MTDGLSRCPIEVRLKRYDGDWQCKISLRRVSDASRGTEEQFGEVVTDMTHLEDMIRRAQFAILNPDMPSSHFLHADISKDLPDDMPPGCMRQQAFSSDVVCLEITGKEVTDLAFIDLPGKAPYLSFSNQKDEHF